MPLPLLNASTLARAHGFGASNRPSLIYVNPLVNSTNLRHDLAALIFARPIQTLAQEAEDALAR